MLVAMTTQTQQVGKQSPLHHLITKATLASGFFVVFY